MNTQLIYTIHNCVTNNGKDRTVTVNGAKAEEYLAFLLLNAANHATIDYYPLLIQSHGLKFSSLKMHPMAF